MQGVASTFRAACIILASGFTDGLEENHVTDLRYGRNVGEDSRLVHEAVRGITLPQMMDGRGKAVQIRLAIKEMILG